MSFIAASILGGAAITAGGSIISASMNGGAPGIEDNYVQGPSYQAGQTAQSNWLNQLTQDQADPTGNFGGISPDWNDIWQQTQQQVNNYYNGTSTSPGVNDQVKASFAQRGMAGDPAASFLTAASGANQASDLTNLSAQENIAKNQFAQTAKQNWYSNMNNFQQSTANQQGNWTGGIPYATPGQQVGNAIGAAGSGLAAYGLQAQSANNQLNYLNSILNGTQYGTPTSQSFSQNLFAGVNGPTG